MNMSNLRLWYDKEADYLEVLYSDEPETFEKADRNQIMVRLNLRQEVVGLSILGVSKIEEQYLDLIVEPARDTLSP